MSIMLETLLSDLVDMATETSWMSWGLCAEADPELWFPKVGEPLRPARKICGDCPVREECLEYALDNDMQAGIWGGLTLRERRRVKRVGLAA